MISQLSSILNAQERSFTYINYYNYYLRNEVLLSVFLTSNSAQLASANTVDSNENFILNENLNTMEMVHEHIGTCDCNTTYEQHDKTLKTLLETNNITTKALACDCGGALNKKVLSN